MAAMEGLAAGRWTVRLVIESDAVLPFELVALGFDKYVAELSFCDKQAKQVTC